ncbi:electron transfer flavoprotein subunit alpha/FixB family protein [Burkholderia contaminans]|uniref:Electron transfer flavoprotein subunit alpha n=1 Tax=Burkholderia contaminans TaxID=488447 RepID=A0A3N8PUY3_9BURK|nr:FAD-binding protein [Burkholderia contaminans]RQT14890.1 electron transfer flavoprotein subunit alpha/FixB family protein [Burkholderia contaminans]
MTTLILAEHDGARLHPATASVVSAARVLPGPVHLLVAGSGVAAIAEQAARIEGVARVLVADAPALEHALAEPVSKQLLAVAQGYDCLLAAATSAGKRVMPRVAAHLGVPQVSDITAVIDQRTFERPMYAGNVIATVRVNGGIVVGTVRTSAFPSPSGSQLPADCITVECVEPPRGARFVHRETLASERPDLASARVVVSGGRGLGSGENYRRVLTPLADKLDAALGASRAAVDSGFAPNDYQVGQTGKIVAPGLYIAVGISGAIQHLAGMKDAQTIVAINQDPEAPIFAVADVGLVADLFEAVPAIVDAL